MSVEIVTNSGWKFRRVNKDAIHLLRSTWFDSACTVRDALGPYWTLSLTKHEKGVAQYFSGTDLVRLPMRYALFTPPYSMLRGEYLSVHLNTEGMIFRKPLPKGFPLEPVIFEPPGWNLPTTIKGALQFLRAGKNHQSVSASAGASALTLKAKCKIEESFRHPKKISEIAKSLRTSGPYLSRQFKKETGFNPVEYRMQMRVTCAAFELLEGSPITDTYHNVGYEDLSQFYRHFKRLTTTTPAVYANKRKSKNPKN